MVTFLFRDCAELMVEMLDSVAVRVDSVDVVFLFLTMLCSLSSMKRLGGLRLGCKPSEVGGGLQGWDMCGNHTVNRGGTN